MTSVWDLRGTAHQNKIVETALELCDFPFDLLAGSLQKEGRDRISVEWADLSRYAASQEGEHGHVHEGEATAHPIERTVDGRKRVLGLFYLPPYTRVVLDVSLQDHPSLAMEVFLAEAAHAVDYHFMSREHRRQITNVLHGDNLPVTTDPADGVAFYLDGHTCSWFDVGPYRMWVGEAFMEGFIEAFAPLVTVTIQLGHPVAPAHASAIRSFLLEGTQPEPEPAPEPAHEHFPVFQSTAKNTKVYHDVHSGLTAAQTFENAHEADDAGLRPCRVCRPV